MSLFVETSGAGRPVVLVHGLFGSSTNWRGIARRLAEGYEVHNVDMINHGRSPHTASMTYRDMSDALLEMAAARKLEDAVWIGHSMGGKALMDMALRGPAGIRRLIVVDIAPVAYEHSHLEYIDAMLNMDLAGLDSRGRADRELAATVGDNATRLFLLQNLILGDNGYTWRINLPMLKKYHRDIMGFPEHDSRFEGPALFISGAQSDYVTAAHHGVIRQYFPGAEFAVVENAGHWVHADQPEALLRILLDNLD